jgi:hypothetical protein
MKTKHARIIASLLLLVLFSGCTKELGKQVSALKDENAKLQKNLFDYEMKTAELTEKLKISVSSAVELGTSNSVLTLEAKQLHSELLSISESSSNEVNRLTSQLTETQNKLQSVQLELASATGELKGLLQEQEAVKKQATSQAALKVQVGLTMGSGETKPAGNMKLYLTKESFCQIVGCDHPNSYGVDITSIDWWTGKKFAGIDPKGAAKSHRIDQSLAGAAIATGTTDFGGQTTFENIPPGDYYIIGTTLLGGGASLMKRVTVNSGQNNVSLGNENIMDKSR